MTVSSSDPKTFSRDLTGIHWLTPTGPVRLPDAEALVLADLLRSAHDTALKAGDRCEARRARKLWFELEDALGDLGTRRAA